MSRDERGVVTAETAVALPLLIAVTLAMTWMLSFGLAQMRSTDAAREAARALARGESVAAATALAHRVSPGVEVRISRDAERVHVTVVDRVEVPGGMLDALGGVTHGEAVALVEEGTDNGAQGDTDAGPA